MLKHGRIGMTRPENFPKPFNVYSVDAATSDIGRVQHSNRTLKGTLRCILSIAKPDEIERFSQIGVKVTHTIFQRGAPAAKEHDIFALVKGSSETRIFEVQAVHNKGEMDIDTTYYCEERGDRKWQSTSQQP